MTSDNERAKRRLVDDLEDLTRRIDHLIVTEAAELYYAENLGPTLRASGVPEEAIAYLSRNYREGVATNAEAKKAIMRWLSEKSGS